MTHISCLKIQKELFLDFSFISLFVVDGNLNNDFVIDSKTGEIKIAKALRGESTYNIRVLAVDGGINPGPLSGSTMVTINVDRVDDGVTSAGESTAKHVTTTPMVAGTAILAPCLFTIVLHGTFLSVY